MTEQKKQITAQTNPNLIGHKYAEDILLHSINRGKMHHAWLITGQKGIGKATLSYRVARFLLTGGADGGLFGVPDNMNIEAGHPIFNRTKQGSHPDFMFLSPKTDPKTGKTSNKILVDDTRKIAKFLSLTPAESEYRIIVIDSIDDMNRNAANSILKILEEPPRNAIIFLVSHSPGKLLPTIRSRCRQLKMQPLDKYEILDVAKKTLDTEYIDNFEELNILSCGSPGILIDLYANDGVALYQEIAEIFAKNMDIEELFKFGDKMAKKDNSHLWELFNYLQEIFWSRVILFGSTNNLNGKIFDSELAIIQAILANKNIEQCLDIKSEIESNIIRTNAINLDKKQSIINIYNEA